MQSIMKQGIVVEKCLLLSANPISKMSHALSIVLQGLTLSVFITILLAMGFKRISFLSWLHFIIKWLNAFSRWHGIFHVYLFIYLFNHYLYTVKTKNWSSGTKNSKNILRTKDHNPHIIWTNTNMPLKNLISMNAVSKNYDREGV